LVQNGRRLDCRNRLSTLVEKGRLCVTNPHDASVVG
jgi:hypothetical protein